MDIVKLSGGSFGCEVRGIDAAALSDADAARLVDLLYAEHVVVVRGQRLAPADYLRYGSRFGEPAGYVRKVVQKDRTIEGFPAIFVVSNSPRTPEQLREDANHWHTDGSFNTVPNNVTMLYTEEAPKAGGETMFTDMAAAYDALSPLEQLLLEGLQVRHYMFAGKPMGDEVMPANPFSEEDKARMKEVVQPIVRPHPATGRKALYAVSGSAICIEGMPRERSDAILAHLKTHATQARFRQQAKGDPGDIVIWDNWATMHRARPMSYTEAEGQRRRLLRISTRGEPPHLAQRRAAALPTTL